MRNKDAEKEMSPRNNDARRNRREKYRQEIMMRDEDADEKVDESPQKHTFTGCFTPFDT